IDGGGPQDDENEPRPGEAIEDVADEREDPDASPPARGEIQIEREGEEPEEKDLGGENHNPHCGKHEIRNPKFETNPNEASTNVSNGVNRFGHFLLRALDLFRISCF